MGKKEKLESKFDHVEEFEKKSSKSVIVLSSSDDEEGNEDLSLKIVEKAMSRASKTTQNRIALDESKNSGGARSLSLIDLSTSPSQEGEAIIDPSGSDGGAACTSAVADVKNKKKSKKEKRKKNKKIEIEKETVDIVMEEERAETVKDVAIVTSMEPSHVEQSDNIVLRKLLRGPRYFDPPNSGWGTCYNCGEEGHTTVNCTSLKRKKPCFVCGSLEHGFKQCTKGHDCFICKRGGHRAKDCPEKHKNISQSSKICLRCGDSGHDMFSCRNDYSCDDVKEIQCYICKSFGHLCCVNFVDASPRGVSCYKCGQLGHIGLACSRLRGETTGVGSPSSCYKCGEDGHFARECTSSTKGETTGVGSPISCYRCGEDGHFARECTSSTKGETTGVGSPSSCYRCGEDGHFARECTSSAKVGKRNREISTPRQRFSKEDKNYLGFMSAPQDLGKARKRKKTHFEERGITTPHKSKQRGGWITEDPGDFSIRKAKMNSWRSPAAPYKISALPAGGQISSSRYSQRPPKHYSGSSTSQGSAKAFRHRFPASRFGSTSSDGMMRNYNW